MHRRLILAAACMCAISAQLTFAQTPAPAPQAGGPRPIPNAVPATPQPPPPPPAPFASGQSIQGQPVNIKVDFTIADQRGTAPPVKRVVSVIASDRNLGRIRSSAIVIGQGAGGPIPLNVD